MHPQDHLVSVGRFVAKFLLVVLRITPRRMGIIVALALLLGIAGQTRPVQATPASSSSIGVWIYAQKLGGQGTICKGDKVNIRVRVVKRIGIEGQYKAEMLFGEEVSAFVDRSGVGSISPAKRTTRLESQPIGSTTFTFTAEKAGTTTVVFQAKVNKRVYLGMEIGGNTIITPMEMTVENCEFRVDMFGHWQVPGEANIHIYAKFKDVGMFEDGEGHYTGKGSAAWVMAFGAVGDCIATIPPFTSEVELSGNVNGPEEFFVDLKLQPASVTETANCGGETQTFPINLTVSGTQFLVSAYGGYARESQEINWDGPAQGTIVLIVRRTGAQ